MPKRDQFHFFDPSQEFSVWYGRLPHWEQPGATYFITFHAADSLPRPVTARWERERRDWLQRRGIDPESPTWSDRFAELPRSQQEQFRRTFAAKIEKELDRGCGECLLREPRVTQKAAEALRYFDGVRYTLGDFVIMPNHIHLLACLHVETSLKKQCTSWKKNIALKLNESLGRSGTYWQKESFDHLVRDVEHYQHFCAYIADNGPKASLMIDEYLHGVCDDW